MRLVAAVATAVAALVPTVPLDATSAYDGLTCHGLPATIVGKGGEHIVGTEGPDVIVSYDPAAHDAGAFSFDSGAGDDVICAATEAFAGDAGPGDDLVDYSGVTVYSSVILGTGSDTFIGGSARDSVVAGDSGAWGYVDSDLDVIDTGDRRDAVVSGGTGPTSDLVTLGRAGDVLHLASPPAVDASFHLGAGPNKVMVDLAGGDPRGDWKVDATTQTLDHEGVAATWSGRVSSYEFGSPGVWMNVDLAFTGSAGPENVVLDARYGRLRADLRLGAGDDSVVDRAPHWRNGSRYAGGPGEDTLATTGVTADGGWAFRQVWVDLARGRADYDFQLDRPDVELSGFERVEAGGRRVFVKADGKDNDLISQACRSELRGGGGDDVLEARDADHDGLCENGVSANLVGGPGDDELVGGRGDDFLDGRGGDDVLRARGGFDTCRGEHLTGCEQLV